VFGRFTPQARQVVVLAQDDARILDHNYKGSEHILLGLLREEEGIGGRVLESLGIAADPVRAQVLEICPPGQVIASSGQLPFTPRSKKVLELTTSEALSLGHNYIGTEHIQLGLVRENGGVAARVLLDLGADAEKIRNEVIRMIPDPGAPPPRRTSAVDKGTAQAMIASVPRTHIRVDASARVRKLLMVAAARALDDGRLEIDVRDLLLALTDDEQTALLCSQIAGAQAQPAASRE
jgi:ATP-dependent Clp protease ATP-binding subunit ClpC